jgi:hypothetical protein
MLVPNATVLATSGMTVGIQTAALSQLDAPFLPQLLGLQAQIQAPESPETGFLPLFESTPITGVDSALLIGTRWENRTIKFNSTAFGEVPDVVHRDP